MEKAEQQKYFWLQYNGEILAEDLPQEYIEQDDRVYCCNEDCFSQVRDKCELFARYADGCRTFGRKTMRGCINDKKRGGWKMPNGKISWLNASFGFAGCQHGATPCAHFIAKDAI